jgi:uncharacterized cupin superfamily protein
MIRPILNIADVELLARAPGFAPTGAAGERYDAQIGFISRQVGAKKLGYNVTAVPPGKRAFPFHNHQVNEEMFVGREGQSLNSAINSIRRKIELYSWRLP